MKRRVILAGAGHAHALVLEDWIRQPPPGVEVVVVSPYPLAPYSGMVPGWLAGHYRFEEVVVDFPALCARGGFRWVQAAIQNLHPEEHGVRLSTGERLDYDRLSINVGSTLEPPCASTATRVLSMRPLADLKAGYEAMLDDLNINPPQGRLRVAAVGAGAAGFECLLAVLGRLRALHPSVVVEGAMISRSGEILKGLSPGARRLGAQRLQAAGVTCYKGEHWSCLPEAPDLVLWATGARPHPWQRDESRRGSLAVNPEGFILINQALQSVSHPDIFATGDCAHWAPPLPKAGVFAVRMGPVLNHNLRASLNQQPLEAYEPQRSYLVLLATADGRAIASRGSLHAQGRWVWRWKDWIDRRFLNRFRGHGQADGNRPQ